MSRKVTLVLTLAVVGGGLAYRLSLAPYSMPGGLSWSLSDDMWYYLKIAQNIAAGRGATFDGLHPTNGFHPLYALILAGLFKLGVSVQQMPAVALQLLAVADAVTGLLLYLILRARGMAVGGLVACCLWLFNPEGVAISHLGVETPLSTMVLAATLLAYLSWRESPGRPVLGLAACGLLVGLAALVRTDSFLMGFALGLDSYLLQSSEGKALRSRLAVAALPLAAVVVVTLPWFIWNLSTFGTISQVSAKALIYRQQASAWLGALEKLETSGLPKLPANFVVLVGWLLYTLAKMPNWFMRLSGTLQPSQLFWLLGGGDALLRAMNCHLGGRPVWRRSGIWRPLVLFLVLVGMAYSLAYHHVHRWYFESSIMVVCLLAGLAAEDISRGIAPLWAGSRRGWWRGALLASLLLLGTAVFNQLQRPFSELEIWRERPGARIEAVVPDGAVVGAFNSGQLGYYCARRVVNLDGVVNNLAYEAIRDYRLWDYMHREGIDYLYDDPGYIKKFARYGGPGYMENVEAVMLPGGGKIYRLPWAREDTRPAT